ncbi:MAG: hypothetical protein VX768_06610 [Planctomycetota bacterium]|nr:hypothetical protein [Planctomycetota bacterium]
MPASAGKQAFIRKSKAPSAFRYANIPVRSTTTPSYLPNNGNLEATSPVLSNGRIDRFHCQRETKPIGPPWKKPIG